MQLNGEKIAYHTKGIIDKDGHHYCIQCSNEDHDYFSTYYSSYLKEEMIYCRRCIQLGRIDSVTEYRITESVQNISDGAYELPLRCQNNNNMHRNQLLMQSNIQRVSYYMRLQAQVRQK